MLSNTGLINILGCVFFFIVMPLGVALCKRLYEKIKSEEHKEKGKVVQTLIKNYCLIQMIVCPGGFLLSWPIEINNDSLHIIDSSETIIAIHMVRALYNFYRVYLSFHSLIVAITRYTFLMYDVQTEIYGVKKLRNLFISFSIGVPLILTFIMICVQPIEVRWLQLFAVYNNSVSIPSEVQYDGFRLGRANIGFTTAEEYNIGIHNLINNLLPSPLVFGLQHFIDVTFFLISMNIVELFLYAHLFWHFHRQEQESGVNELLNDNAKQRRKHTKTVNIQMSVMTWLIEFITGCLLIILFTLDDNITIIVIIALLDGIMTFVAIPGAYILNTEIMKSKIIQNGWFRSLRPLRNSRRIHPAENEAANDPNNQ